MLPLLNGILYWLGGQYNKLFRWLGIGLAVGIVGALNKHSYIPLLSVATYFVATNIFSYGDGNWTSKIFGRWVSMGLAGFTYGLASIFVLGWLLALIQGIVGCGCFLVLKYLDDNDILKLPWVELIRGFVGTILYFSI